MLARFRSFNLLMLLTVVLAVGALVPASALAERSYIGSSYSSNYPGVWTTVIMCDNNANGKPEYAEYITNGGGTSRLDDGNGSQSGCGVQDLSAQMRQHRACRGEIGNDPCGAVVRNPAFG